MIRVKMSPFKRMQNFLFIDDEIFWTSASLSIWQKIKRWWNKDDSKMCNTSGGFTLPFHGQYVRYDKGFIRHMSQDIDTLYNPINGKEVGKIKSTLPDIGKARKLRAGIPIQGFAFVGDTAKYVVFGAAGRDDITVYNMDSKKLHKVLCYSDFTKKHWDEWENEGIQFDANGELWVGFDVKTKHGLHESHIVKV